MTLLDADVLVIDNRDKDDRKEVNRQFLDSVLHSEQPFGILIQPLLETVGVLSYGSKPSRIRMLPVILCMKYRLSVIPDPVRYPEYAYCTFAELVDQMTKKMSLGDAVQAVQIEKYAPDAKALVTWNAKHFDQKICVPVLTPAEWLAAHPAAAQS